MRASAPNSVNLSHLNQTKKLLRLCTFAPAYDQKAYSVILVQMAIIKMPNKYRIITKLGFIETNYQLGKYLISE